MASVPRDAADAWRGKHRFVRRSSAPTELTDLADAQLQPQVFARPI